MEKGTGQGNKSSFDITQGVVIQNCTGRFHYNISTSGCKNITEGPGTIALPSGTLAALTQGNVWEVSPLQSAMSTDSLALPFENKTGEEQ